MPNPPRLYAWFTEARVTYWLKTLLLVIAAAYVLGGILTFLARIETIVVILIASIFFAYLLYPVIRALNRRLPLIGAILVVYGSLFVLFALAAFFIIPPLSTDISTIVQGYPRAIATAQNALRNPSTPYISHLPQWLRNTLANVPGELQAWVRVHGSDAAVGALTVLTGTLSAVAAMVIVPVLSAYLLMDSENLKRYSMGLIPQSKREKSLEVLSELEQVIGGFIRGQILVGASVGILITVMLMIMHVPYALLIGVGAAVLDVIPYVGAVAAFIPAVLLAAFTNGPINALIVAGLFIAIFQAEGNFIAPHIVSRTVSLSPLAVLLAILIGGDLMGVVGMFIAVPVAGILRVVAYHVIPPKASAEEAQPALTEAPREAPLDEPAPEAAVET
ncbi:MAG TPA: AI-2E family transporter [Candidatus Baltobacteraceae bacterium]|jgi:predicted PurR-regulated permease PerM